MNGERCWMVFDAGVLDAAYLRTRLWHHKFAFLGLLFSTLPALFRSS